MKKSLIVINTILVVVLLVSTIELPQKYVINKLQEKRAPRLIPQAAIFIDSDDDFITYGFPGNGSKEDPYRIENHTITSSDEIGIYITGTTKCLIIQNCYIGTKEYGIYIESVADGSISIINNTCIDTSHDGISVNYSNSTLIENNTCYDNFDFGIFLYFSNNSKLLNNTCDNCWKGIELIQSSNTTIINNTCTNSWDGIEINNSPQSIMIENTCTNNRYSGINILFSPSAFVSENLCSDNNIDGILSLYSDGSTLINNKLKKNGIYIQEESLDNYLSYYVSGNIVNNKPFGYITNQNNNDISDDYGQLMLINCTNTIIENQSIANTSMGITLLFCTECNVTDNIIVSNSQRGIYIYQSPSIYLANNFCQNNYAGIYAWEAPFAVLHNNTCINNSFYGIYVEDSFYSVIRNNFCSHTSYHGILVSNSNYAILKDNLINYNHHQGILISVSNFVEIINNTVASNEKVGIYLDFGYTCKITYNCIYQNFAYGLFLNGGSDNNVIFHNNFTENNLGGTSQAYDSGKNNTWYDKKNKSGNYWSDWIKKGKYSIDGSANNYDKYPLDENNRPYRPYSVVFALVGVIAFLMIFGSLSYHIFKKKKIKK